MELCTLKSITMRNVNKKYTTETIMCTVYDINHKYFISFSLFLVLVCGLITLHYVNFLFHSFQRMEICI